MRFYADLHVHSKYSRATSRDLDLEHLALWAKRKGIRVVGTGDFTHPAWWQELQDKLVATNRRIQELQSRRDEGSSMILTEEQRRAFDAAVAAGRLDGARLTRWRKLAAEETRNRESLAERRARDRAFGKMAKSIMREKRRRNRP